MTLRRFAMMLALAISLLLAAILWSLTTRAPSSNAQVTVASVPGDAAAGTEAADDGSIAAEEPTPSPVSEPDPSHDADGPGESEPAAVATPVEPPALIQIPADLISTPTPEPDQAPLPMLTRIPTAPRDGGVVYLTFDDGPDPAATSQLLDVLASYGAKATFFVLGSQVDAYPGVVQRITAEGHTLGNHTYWHEALPNESPDHVIQTLAATNSAIQRATGRTSVCVRPPYGALDRATFDVIAGQGYRVSMWEVDSNDWKTTDSQAIAAHVLANTDLGHRVLFHDGPSGRGPSVQAVAMVLEVLSARGVTFAALPCS